MSASSAWSVASAVLAALGGGALLVLAFSSWLGKVWASRILASETAEHARNLERIKRQLESQLHAGRSLFDAEFAIYRELWACASRVGIAAQNLEPWHLQTPFSGDERESIHERFTAELIAFDDFAEASRPFFSPDVYAGIQQLVEACRAERNRFSIEPELDHMKQSRSRAESMMRVGEATNDLCEAIRSRLYASVAPHTASHPAPLPREG